MQSQLLINIKQLVNTGSGIRPLYGKEMADLPCLENAWLLIEGEEIAGFGKMDSLKKDLPNLPGVKTDCNGKLVLPCWCDSHTHIVFAGSRESEFVDKIRGLSYAEINARGGGILNTVQKINEISSDELFRISWKRLEEVTRLGTGAIEIKSGYGLSLEGELKMLRVIRQLKEKSSLHIKSTFLGAHAYPLIYRENHAAYIKEIVDEMLPVIAKEKLADYIDVFCEKGFFSPEESEIILRAGLRYGLQPKMHVNQLNATGGVETGIKLNAISMDHLEIMPDEDISKIKNSGWKGICTLLPAAAFFLRMEFPPARKLLDSGFAIALASDYNPGSAPSGNMNIVIALACIQMKLLPEEALNAATINGAFAMGLGNSLGTISRGKLANLIITSQVPSMEYLPYSFGSNLIDKIIIRGKFIA
ncbi:MAG TPA: imidazolonepropionase [Puia sp.]|nr:imidazolonepropionase [Puia sp.]